MWKTAINNLETYVNIQNIKFKCYDGLKSPKRAAFYFMHILSTFTCVKVSRFDSKYQEKWMFLKKATMTSWNSTRMNHLCNMGRTLSTIPRWSRNYISLILPDDCVYLTLSCWVFLTPLISNCIRTYAVIIVKRMDPGESIIYSMSEKKALWKSPLRSVATFPFLGPGWADVQFNNVGKVDTVCSWKFVLFLNITRNIKRNYEKDCWNSIKSISKHKLNSKIQQ